MIEEVAVIERVIVDECVGGKEEVKVYVIVRGEGVVGTRGDLSVCEIG